MYSFEQKNTNIIASYKFSCQTMCLRDCIVLPPGGKGAHC